MRSIGFGLLIFSMIAIASPSCVQAQLTWDPDGNQAADGGNGTWDFFTANWDDNGAAPNIGWVNNGDAIFGASADGSISDIGIAAFSGITVRDITLSPGSGAVRFEADFDGDGLTLASGGSTWDLGGRSLIFANNDGIFSSDTALFEALGSSGNVLTVVDSVGGGTFNTGERPTSASWLVSNTTLDFQGAFLRGNAGSVGQFATVRLGDGSRYIHERNSGEGYANNWEISGDVTFDNRFTRLTVLNGLVSDGTSPGRLVVADLSGSLLRLTNDANDFTGGVLIDSTNSRSELDFLNTSAAETSGFGAVPAAFDPDNITLRNGGELRLRGQTINSNRGITLDGGGIIILNSAPATYGGTITGTGGLQIGRPQGADGNRLVLTSNTHTYSGDTVIHQGSIQLGIDNAIPTDSILTIGGTGGSRLFLEGFDQEIAGLRTAANNTREIVNDGASASTLTINTPEGTSSSYVGNFRGTNTVDVVKNGAGTQVFSRGNNFTVIPSSFTVNGGRLRVTNPILDDDPNSTSTPTALLTTVTVNSGGTFVLDAGQATPNDGNDWDQDEIDLFLSQATFNAGSLLGINTQDGDFTYSSNLTGNQGLNKIQTNTLELTGTNTYAGPTVIENGTLLADTPASLPDTGLTVQGEEGPGYIGFNLANWSEAQVDARIAGATFDPNAGVELAIESDENYSLDIPGDVTNFALRATPDSADLTLAGSNSYTGSTTVRSGTLIKGAVTAIPAGTQLRLGEGDANARFEMNGFDQSTTGLQTSTTGAVEIANSTAFTAPTTTLTIDTAGGESFVYNGRLGGSTGLNDNNFNVVKNGTGSQTFGGSNTYTGTTTINAGSLTIVQPLDAAALGVGDVTVAAGATVILEGGGVSEWSDGQIQDFLADQTFGADTTFGIQTNGEDFTFSGVVSGDKNFVRTANADDPVLTLTQSQTYTGDTHFERGRVILAAANTLPTSTVVTIGSPNSGARAFMDGNNQEIAGLVGGGSGGGVRQWNNGSTTAATLTINVAGGESYAYPHALGEAGNADFNNFALTKAGAGTQSIANSTYTGATNVNGGTLLFTGNAGQATGDVTVASGATVGGGGTIGGAIAALSGSTVAPGNEGAGTLNLLTDLVLNSGATLAFELQGDDQTVGGGVNDLINLNTASGSLTLNGDVDVSALVASTADFNGDGSVNGLDLAQWEGDVGLNGNSDADGDGDSDGADYLAWQRDLGISGDFLGAEAGDRWTLVTYDEANVTLTNNLSLGSLPALSPGLGFVLDDSIVGQIDLVVQVGALVAQVPEPSSLVLLSIGAIGLLGRRIASFALAVR